MSGNTRSLFISTVTNSVVEVREVNGQGEVAAKGCQRVRERRRVRPAGDRDNNDLSAAQHPVPAQGLADPLDQRQVSVCRSVPAHTRVHIVGRAAGQRCLQPAGAGITLMMVAAEGFEPPTPRV